MFGEHTSRLFHSRRALSLGLLLGVGTSLQAATTFTYQGQLKRGGAPVNDVCQLTFRLFDAAIDGNQVGPEVVVADSPITNGLFQADLDFGTGRFDGNNRWLDVSLLCTGDVTSVTLAPRRSITATPQAINADALDGLDSTAFLRSVPNPLSLSGAPALFVIRGTNTSGGSGASGVIGEATATSGSTFGVWGVNASAGGIGVLGQHTSNAGTAAGVAGESSSGATAAVGVYGRVTGLAAVNYGVFGESPSSAGRGIYGKATGLTGTNYGVHGEGVSATGAGMFAFSTLGDGIFARSDGSGKAAMSAQTTNANGWAILARHTSPAGMHATIQGETSSGINGAKGVYGLALNTAGATYGVFGETAGATGQGVAGLALATTGVTYGVHGQTNSTTNGAAGVVGIADATFGQTYGVFGQSDSNTGYSVYGLHAGTGRGVFGSSASGTGVHASTAGGTALFAERTSNGNRGWIGSLSEGVYGESSSGTGVLGKTVGGPSAVQGERTANGNRGSLGTPTEGAYGEAAAGDGVAGISTDAIGHGGYFRNDGGGAALFADGIAKVRTLEIVDGGDLAEPFVVNTDQPVQAESGSDSSIRAESGSDGPFRAGSGSDGPIRAESGSDPILESHGATAPRSHEGERKEEPSDGTPNPVQPGMVVVIDPRQPGALRLSHEPYDRKVAGIISGANGLSPGMLMKATPRTTAPGDHNVALTGRVWCWCDATTETGTGPIEPGDLLTTSRTVGHAMKVTPDINAHGAVIGKAMTPLPKGRGMVLVLVNLQ